MGVREVSRGGIGVGGMGLLLRFVWLTGFDEGVRISAMVQVSCCGDFVTQVTMYDPFWRVL